MGPLMDGWMDDLQFYVLFNSISVISGQWADDNERLCLERSSNSGRHIIKPAVNPMSYRAPRPVMEVWSGARE